MKIVQFFNMHSNKYGSLERFFISLVEDCPKDEFYFIYNSYPKSSQFVNDCKRLNIKILTTKYSCSTINDIKNSLCFAKIIKSIKPDIVHFHFGNIFNFYTRIARYYGVTKLYKTQHSCLTTSNVTQYTSYQQLPFWKRVLISDPFGGYSHFLKVLCVGKYVKEQFDKVYTPALRYTSSSFVYFGVKEPIIIDEIKKRELKNSLEINLNTKVLVTTLFANPIKGLDILLKSLSFIKESNFVLLILGIDENTAFAKQCHRLASELNIQSKLKWIGVTDNVSKYLSISDFYIQPSRTEALPFAACEALSYGLPVIGSNVGGLPEVSSLTFERENSKDLSDKINLLLSDNKMLEKLSKEGKEFYNENLSLDEGIRQYKQLYGI